MRPVGLRATGLLADPSRFRNARQVVAADSTVDDLPLRVSSRCSTCSSRVREILVLSEPPWFHSCIEVIQFMLVAGSSVCVTS